VGGEAEFDASFNGNPLVNVVCIGLVESDKIVRGIAPNAGDTMMLIGSKTGRDGIHGVTFASEELTTGSEEESRPAVQIEDPLSEKLLIDSFMEIFKTSAFAGCKDLGGGGFSCATSEIVHKGGMGARIDLDKLPRREEGMEPWEVLLSETQERMMLIVKKGREADIEKILDKWDVLNVRVGVVTDDGHYQITHNGEIIVDMPTHFLTNDPTFTNLFNPMVEKGKVIKPEIRDSKEYFLNLLKEPNIASKKWIYQQYDNEVQVRSVTKPGQDASITRITDKAGAVLGVGCNSAHCAIDPIEGSKEALAEALRNVTAVGGIPLAAVDCLNFGNPEKPKAMWQFKVAVENLAEGLKFFNIPVISGNVSFYNETDGKVINVSPIVTLVGKVELDKTVNISLKEDGDSIILIGKTHDELGDAPKVDFQIEKKTNGLVLDLIDKEKINACHDLSKGGLAIGLAKMAFDSNRGFDVRIARMDEGISDEEKLFSESNARYVVTTKKPDAVLEAAKQAGMKAQVIGSVGGDELSYGPFSVKLNKAKEGWENSIEELLF